MNVASHTIEKRKEPLTFNLLDLLVLFYMAHRLLPAVGQFTPGIVFLGAFAMTALMLCMSRKNMIRSTYFTQLVFVFSLSLLGLVERLLNDNMATTATYVYGQLQSFLYGWIALYYISKAEITKARRLLKLVVAFYIITIVTTYVGNIIYPQASRLMATFNSTDSRYILYTSRNIGGFSFIYELSLLAALLVYLIKTRKLNRILGIVALVAIGLLFLQAEYTTALLAFLATLCLLFVKKITATKIIVFVVVAIILFLVFGGLVANLLDEIADIVPSDTMSVRLKYFAASLRGEEIEETEGANADSGNRIKLYQKSLKAIVETKFMGGWGYAEGSGHSFILDSMAQYGILGMVALVIAYRMMYCVAIKPHKNKGYYPYLVWIYLMSIALAVVNTKLNQYIFIFIIPLFARVVDSKEDAEKEEQA